MALVKVHQLHHENSQVSMHVKGLEDGVYWDNDDNGEAIGYFLCQLYRKTQNRVDFDRQTSGFSSLGCLGGPLNSWKMAGDWFMES